MTRWFIAAVVASLASMSLSKAQGATPFHVDDTGSLVFNPVLSMEWQKTRPPDQNRLVEAKTSVNVQLDVSRWVGGRGRLYMVLPKGPGPVVRASWTTSGILLPGTLISGDRALVYSGIVSGPILRDNILLSLKVDSLHLNAIETLNFSFEYEAGE